MTNVSTSFTTGIGCTGVATATAANVAGYKYGNSTSCTTTIRLVGGGEMVFVAANDAVGYAASLTNVRLSLPATTTALTSAPNPSTFGQSVTFTATVTGGVGVPAGNANFKDGAVALGSSALADAGSGLSVVSIASGVEGDHACAIMTDGGVKCWGANGDGQLGNGTTTSSNVPVDVQGLTGIVAIGVGSFHSCALTSGGGVKCWGFNFYGQLGSGGSSSSIPVDVNGLTSGVTAIAVGKNHSCALTSSGSVKCWGNSIDGQVGDDFRLNRTTPVDVSGLTSGVGAIASGGDRTCAIIAATGAAKCWGNNVQGGIGDNSTTNRLVPTDVSGLTSGVAKVSVGNDHTCAVTTAGAAMCWGFNSSGRLGDGTTTTRLTPVAVSTLGSNVGSISAGRDHTCALMTTGAAKCWGSNVFGQLGTGTSSSSSPVDVAALGTGVKSIVAAKQASYAVTTGLGAKSWGLNDSGRLGDGGTTDRSLPGDVSGLAAGRATATLATNSFSAGNRNLTGVYAGDGNRTGSTSPFVVQAVNKASSNISVTTSPPSPSTFGQTVTLTATVTSGVGTPTGTVTFTDTVNGANTGALGTVPLNAGVATVSTAALSAGVHTIFAAYSGDANRDLSAITLGYTVNQAPNTITFPALANRVFGAAPPVPAATASSGLTVTYSSTTTSVCTVTSGGVITILSAGTCSITASQAGNANFVAATPVSRSFSVTQAANTITFPALANRVFGAAPPVAAATASSGLAIAYTSTTAPVCTVTSGGVITILSVGTCSITASQAGNVNFVAATPVSQSFSVTKGATTTALATSSANIAFGASVTLTASVGVVAPTSATPSGVVTFFRAGSVAIGTAAVSAGQAVLATTALPAGANSITASYDVAGSDPSLSTSTSAAVAVDVAQLASTTALSVSPNPVLLGGNVTATATVTGTGATGSVTFKDGANDVAVVALVNGAASAILSPPIDGLHPITAVYAGDPNVTTSTSNVVNLLAYSSCADAFAGALPLAGANGTVFGSTVGATGEAGEPNHAGNSGALNSVWCTWTAPAAGNVTIDTTGSGFDTTLAVYTGASVDALTTVAANDNIGPGSTQSRVSFAATAGVAYRIAIDGVSATGDYVLNIALAPAETPVTFASVLPTARSITTKTVATAFATIINSGAATATGCSLAAPPGFPAEFSYQTTDATNAPSGTANTPIDIAAGAAQGFFFAVTPLVDLNSSEFAIVFDCTNTPTTITVPGLNTLLLSSSSTPVPDLISIGATPSGDGIANIPGPTGVTAFGAATVNIGATDVVTASIDDNGLGLALTALLCVTDPATGACTNPAAPAPSVSFSLANGTSATVAVFVTGTGIVPFDPGANRLFLRFKTADGVTRGATSVAVRTQ